MGRVFVILYFYPLCVCPVDDEKLDERAKLSVAAKRSLFRVSFTGLFHQELLAEDSRIYDLLFIYFFPSSRSWEDFNI